MERCLARAAARVADLTQTPANATEILDAQIELRDAAANLSAFLAAMGEPSWAALDTPARSDDAWAGALSAVRNGSAVSGRPAPRQAYH
ncbi:MAG: hypothetical protein EON90_02310 [Brevundimonas sp.]|nr:MAG: hypothetical protein EON90_02310 [Brevundimonas sp.]